jgi:hypothetical protein
MSEPTDRTRPARSRNAAGERLPDQALPLPSPAPFGSWAERRIARARLNTTGDERLDTEIREALVQVAAEADRLWDGIARRAKGPADDPDLRAEIIAMIRSLEGVWARERHEAVDFTWARRSAARAAAWGAAASALEQLDPLLVDQLSQGITVEPISLREPEIPAGTLAPVSSKTPAAKTPVKKAPAKTVAKAASKKVAAPKKPVKQAASKKVAAPKKPVKQAAPKKTPVKAVVKAASKKVTPKRAAKTAPKKPVKQAAPKKAPVKAVAKQGAKKVAKAAPKKAPAKAVARQAASAKRPLTKQSPRAAAKRTAAKTSPTKRPVAKKAIGKRPSGRRSAAR